MRALVLTVTQEPHVRSFLTSGPGRQLARRFVAGESLDDALAATCELVGSGSRVALNYLGEAVETVAEAKRAAQVYLRALEALRGTRLAATLALKPTQLGLALDRHLATSLVTEIAAEAERQSTAVRLDMESSQYTDAILDLWRQVFARHRNVGVVLQAALYRTDQDLERVLADGGSVRLCKGAYAEPPSIASQNWRDVRSRFDRLSRRLLAAAATMPPGPLPIAAIATHDALLVDRARRHARALGLDGSRFELQMLYGVRRDLQNALRRDGEPLRVYVPWGPSWYHYLTRRLAERPANLMFLGRALVTELLASIGYSPKSGTNGNGHS